MVENSGKPDAENAASSVVSGMNENAESPIETDPLVANLQEGCEKAERKRTVDEVYDSESDHDAAGCGNDNKRIALSKPTSGSSKTREKPLITARHQDDADIELVEDLLPQENRDNQGNGGQVEQPIVLDDAVDLEREDVLLDAIIELQPAGNEFIDDEMENDIVEEQDFMDLDSVIQNFRGRMDGMMHDLDEVGKFIKELKDKFRPLHSQTAYHKERGQMKNGLEKDIIESWKNGLFTDLTLVDGSGKKHHVHKVVLASRSTYFRAQLTNWDKDSKEIPVRMVNSDILQIILQFIYTLDIQDCLDSSNVMDLLQAANIYDLKLMRDECLHFVKRRMSLTNIIDVIGCSRIDDELEMEASNFLSRNLSNFLNLGPKGDSRLSDVLSVPVEIMKSILDNKMLILRDENGFPLKAVVRETEILKFVIQYILHREDTRIKHSKELLSLVKFHLLPLDPNLAFSRSAYMPDLVYGFIEHICDNSASVPLGLQEKLDEIEQDVKYLHTLEDKNELYRETLSIDLMESNPKSPKKSGKDDKAAPKGGKGKGTKGGKGKKEKPKTRVGDRYPHWNNIELREGSLAHEWWTAHGHDSRISHMDGYRGSQIVGISGSADSSKFMVEISFYLGFISENRDLLPDWFRFSQQNFSESEISREAQYIACIHVVWSNGSDDWLGSYRGMRKEKHTISLKKGEHIVETYQLAWASRHHYIPLDVCDFIFYTNKGRCFGPFTQQMKKYLSASKSNSQNHPDVRCRVTAKKIHRRADFLISGICRTLNVKELRDLNLSNTDRRNKGDNWLSWLDGFLVVIRNDKIIRISLKFSVYLGCLYMDKPAMPAFHRADPSLEGRVFNSMYWDGTRNQDWNDIMMYLQNKHCMTLERMIYPMLCKFTLDDLAKNLSDKVVRIHDADYLQKNLTKTYAFIYRWKNGVIADRKKWARAGSSKNRNDKRADDSSRPAGGGGGGGDNPGDDSSRPSGGRGNPGNGGSRPTGRGGNSGNDWSRPSGSRGTPGDDPPVTSRWRNRLGGGGGGGIIPMRSSGWRPAGMMSYLQIPDVLSSASSNRASRAIEGFSVESWTPNRPKQSNARHSSRTTSNLDLLDMAMGNSSTSSASSTSSESHLMISEITKHLLSPLNLAETSAMDTDSELDSFSSSSSNSSGNAWVAPTRPTQTPSGIKSSSSSMSTREQKNGQSSARSDTPAAGEKAKTTRISMTVSQAKLKGYIPLSAREQPPDNDNSSSSSEDELDYTIGMDFQSHTIDNLVRLMEQMHSRMRHGNSSDNALIIQDAESLLVSFRKAVRVCKAEGTSEDLDRKTSRVKILLTLIRDQYNRTKLPRAQSPLEPRMRPLGLFPGRNKKSGMLIVDKRSPTAKPVATSDAVAVPPATNGQPAGGTAAPSTSEPVPGPSGSGSVAPAKKVAKKADKFRTVAEVCARNSSGVRTIAEVWTKKNVNARTVLEIRDGDNVRTPNPPPSASSDEDNAADTGGSSASGAPNGSGQGGSKTPDDPCTSSPSSSDDDDDDDMDEEVFDELLGLEDRDIYESVVVKPKGFFKVEDYLKK